jgi:alpha-tubulin suppressor-like RCC1 family protein
MEIRKSSGLIACTLLVSLALMSGCGGKSTTTTTIPATATVFYAHNLIFRNNTAMTLGYNGFGQLGLGSLVTFPVAAKVGGTGPVSGGATGAEHTLVFGNRTTVMSWGYNLYGQLGSAAIPAASATASYSWTPVTVAGFGQTVTSVAAGAYHSLAVAGGKVYGWGYNGYGQVGDGTVLNRATPVPVVDNINRTAGLNPAAIQVAAGANHSLALLSDGTVWGWGRNTTGQLGFDPASINGTSSQGARQIPLPLPAGVTVIQIAAQGSNSYALASDNTVWAWGYNFAGELGKDPAASLPLGYSFTPDKIYTDAVRTSINELKATKISAGGNHVLALGVDGAVWAWGLNQAAQLGNNSTVNSPIAVKVLNLPAAQPVTDIRAFGDYSMAKVGSDALGTWYGWGSNSYGQIGNPISTSSISYLLVPAQVLGYRP